MHKHPANTAACANTNFAPMEDDAKTPSDLTRADMDTFFNVICAHTEVQMVQRFRSTLYKYIKHLTRGISNTPQKKLPHRKHVLVQLWISIMERDFLTASLPKATAKLIAADLVDLTRFKELYKDEEIDDFLDYFSASLERNASMFMHDASTQVPLQIATGTQEYYTSGSPAPELSEQAEGLALFGQGKLAEAIAIFNSGIAKIERVPHRGEHFEVMLATLSSNIGVVEFSLVDEYKAKNDVVNAYAHALLGISRLFRMDITRVSSQIIQGRNNYLDRFVVILREYIQHMLATNNFDELVVALSYLRIEVNLLQLSKPSKLDLTKYLAVTFYQKALHCKTLPHRGLVLNSLHFVAHETLQILAAEKHNPGFIKLLLIAYQMMVNEKLDQANELINAKEYIKAIELNVECVTQARLSRSLLTPGTSCDLETKALNHFEKNVTAYADSATDLGQSAILIGNVYALLNNDAQLTHINTAIYFHITINHAMYNYTNGNPGFALTCLVFVSGSMQLNIEAISTDELLNRAYSLEKAFSTIASDGFNCDKMCLYNTKKLIADICADKAKKLKKTLLQMPVITKLFLESTKQLSAIPQIHRAAYQNQLLQEITRNMQNSQEWLLFKMRNVLNTFKDKIRVRISLFNDKQQSKFSKHTTQLQLLITTLNMQVKDTLPELAMLKQMKDSIEHKIDTVRNDYPYLQLIYDIRLCVVNLIYLEEHDSNKIESSALTRNYVSAREDKQEAENKRPRSSNH